MRSDDVGDDLFDFVSLSAYSGYALLRPPRQSHVAASAAHSRNAVTTHSNLARGKTADWRAGCSLVWSTIRSFANALRLRSKKMSVDSAEVISAKVKIKEWERKFASVNMRVPESADIKTAPDEVRGQY